MTDSPFCRARGAVELAGETVGQLRDSLKLLESEFLTPAEAAKLLALETFANDTIRQLRTAWADFESEWSQNLEFGPADDPASAPAQAEA